MTEQTHITRRGMILGAMTLPVALDMALAAPGTELMALMHHHRQADEQLGDLIGIGAYEEGTPAHHLWPAVNEGEKRCRRALLGYVPRNLGEVRKMASYLYGRMTPFNYGDFEDFEMVEAFVSSLAEIEVAA